MDVKMEEIGNNSIKKLVFSIPVLPLTNLQPYDVQAYSVESSASFARTFYFRLLNYSPP